MRMIEDSLGDETPPEGMAPALRALWWLKKGRLHVGAGWEKAHDICQGREGDPVFDAIHALVHRIEGDKGNAAYWDRRAGTDLGRDGPEAEWAALVVMAEG